MENRTRERRLRRMAMAMAMPLVMAMANRRGEEMVQSAPYPPGVSLSTAARSVVDASSDKPLSVGKATTYCLSIWLVRVAFCGRTFLGLLQPGFQPLLVVAPQLSIAVSASISVPTYVEPSSSYNTHSIPRLYSEQLFLQLLYLYRPWFYQPPRASFRLVDSVLFLNLRPRASLC